MLSFLRAENILCFVLNGVYHLLEDAIFHKSKAERKDNKERNATYRCFHKLFVAVMHLRKMCYGGR